MEVVAISPYDLAWPESYRREEAALRRVLGNLAVAIEHVGSTSIVGMHARPTIDIIVGVALFPLNADLSVVRLTPLGWEHRPDIEARLPLPERRRYLHKPGGAEYLGRRAFQLHILEYRGPIWENTLSSAITCGPTERRLLPISNSNQFSPANRTKMASHTARPRNPLFDRY